MIYWLKTEKKPCNLKTMILTSVVCIFNIEKVAFKDFFKNYVMFVL